MTSTYHNTLKGYLVPFISLIYMVGMMGTRPLIPLLAVELGANSINVGFIVALFPLLPFFTAIKAGIFIDKIGYKRPLIVSIIFGSIALILPFWFDNLLFIYFSQIIAGFAQLVFVVAAQAYSGRKSNPEERERNVFTFSLGVAIGSFLGPFIGGICSDQSGYPIAFFILGFVSFLSVFFAFFLEEDKNSGSGEENSKIHFLQTMKLLEVKNLRYSILLSILILLGKDMYVAFFPLLGKEFGLSDTYIGTIIGLNAGAGIVARWCLPSLVHRFSKNTIVLITTFMSGLFFCLLPFFTKGLALVTLSILLGLTLGIGQPISVLTTISSLPSKRRGEGLGLRLSLNRFFQMTSPVLLGFSAHLIGIFSVFIIVGGIIIMGSTKIKIEE
ncbi:MFS transporter [Calidifontibacillus oryziterrae]|uniref:MFS transporter n=1 Tax=Calidifontibacillus oryziterrae TaxID=1191699 RepID=UPI000307AD03|nr:MFS transporter [Calidifontibacillus oryziterrae]